MLIAGVTWEPNESLECSPSDAHRQPAKHSAVAGNHADAKNDRKGGFQQVFIDAKFQNPENFYLSLNMKEGTPWIIWPHTGVFEQVHSR